jgi:7-cyano-7-deazaguanine synthase in queuosine biosynthesis
MRKGHSVVTVLGNKPGPRLSKKAAALHLNYLQLGKSQPNVRVALPKFVTDVYQLPKRILDLLEIAAYTYAADRFVPRGPKNAVEYHAWAREFRYHIRVRDYKFWSRSEVTESLSAALEFMTGDYRYSFKFYPGHSTPPISLFDREDFQQPGIEGQIAVLPFSGGLDSLAGALDLLEHTETRVCLVSHQSQSGTKRTQNALVAALREKFKNRVFHYCFGCHLAGERAREETQRTRAFLFSSIAFAVATAFRQDRFFLFENGVTGINLTRREDLANARASRTTHPKTVYLLKMFLSLVANKEIEIELPFLWLTKAEVVRRLWTGSMRQLISSAVSCSRTFQITGNAPQCGECFQCIDRRIAAHAAGADEIDHRGLYANDIINRPIGLPENRTTVVDYLRLAGRIADWNIDRFYDEMLNDLTEIINYLPAVGDESSAVEKVWNLHARHAEEVGKGIQCMRTLYDNPYKPLEAGSLLSLIAGREYLKPAVERLVEAIGKILTRSVPIMFQKGRRPQNEPDLNAKVAAILDGHVDDLRSEHPATSFACASVVPDHTLTKSDLLIESKYIRGGTPPAKANEGIASDLTKYPTTAHILFFVYDPDGAITNEKVFKEDIEAKGRCTVCIVR